MRYRGRITTWKQDRGFGFITPTGPGPQIFLHASSIANRTRNPNENELVTYAVKIDSQGRPEAHEVSFLSDRYTISPPFLIATCFLLMIAGLVVIQKLPFAVLSLYSAASLITFLAYATDKSAAQQSQWRTSEGTLHLLGLCGGWPGALIARHVYRHKTRKQSFIATFWVTVVLNCGILLLVSLPWTWRDLMSVVQQMVH